MSVYIGEVFRGIMLLAATAVGVYMVVTLVCVFLYDDRNGGTHGT